MHLLYRLSTEWGIIQETPVFQYMLFQPCLWSELYFSMAPCISRPQYTLLYRVQAYIPMVRLQESSTLLQTCPILSVAMCL